MLEGVHTTYNDLTSRFEVSLDDNRNVSYPFEYCWQKTNEKVKVDDKNSENDEFDEMWIHSQKNKVTDTATNFGNKLKLTDTVNIN